MFRDILHRPAALARLAPVEPRLAPLFCLALLMGACALASFALACATPFAAYAVVAAAMLPLPAALAVTAAAWIVNQTIGFGALGYPLDANTVFWGLGIGAAALIATLASRLVLGFAARMGRVAALGLALVGAYAAYEVALFALTPVLGGAGSFTLAIVVRLGVLNLLWLIGLVAVCTALRYVADLRRQPALS